MSKTYLEPPEIGRLEGAAEYLRDKLLVRVLFRLGCRISEAMGITVDDVDFSRSTVTIHHLKARIKLACPHCGSRLAKTARFCSSCGQAVEKALARQMEHHRLRTLPVDEETLGMLRDYVARGGSVSHNGKQLLFGMNRHRAWQVVKECAQKAGLPQLINPETGKVRNVSPHRLRDAFAIHAVKRNDTGEGLRLLQEHLGHQSITTTMRYRKISGEEHRDWYQKLWDEVTAKTEPK